MSVWGQIGIGALGSLVATVAWWFMWCMWIRSKAGAFCGDWEQFKFLRRALVPVEGRPIMRIRRGPWWRPDRLLYAGEHDARHDAANPGERRRLQGIVAVNPVATHQAIAVMRYVGEEEFSVQEYAMPEDGVIYVRPAEQGYDRHVLKRRPK